MNNPVMVKELRGRMRGLRAFAVLSVFLLCLSCLAVLIYMVATASMSAGGGLQGISAGKIVFSALFLFELFLVSFLTPAFTAGSFSGERERRTYDLLFSTPLPVGSIVFGKLVSALAYVLLIVVASVPLLGTAFFMGGVAPEEVAIGLWILLVTAIGFGSVGVFFSSFLKSTVASTVLTYAMVLALTVGIPILTIAVSPFVAALGSRLNPEWFESLVVLYSGGLIACTNPFIVAGATEALYSMGRSLFFFTETMGNQKVFIPSPWLVFSAVYALFTVGLNFAAVRVMSRTRS